jgi:hypothetical protein
MAKEFDQPETGINTPNAQRINNFELHGHFYCGSGKKGIKFGNKEQEQRRVVNRAKN